MPRINVTTNEGELIEVIDFAEDSYNMKSSIHKMELMMRLEEIIERTMRIEKLAQKGE